MNLKIDPSSGLPIYHQLIEQIKHSIAIGVMKAEDQLPSVRKLSMDLRINPNTIAKAYNIMEMEGIVYTKRGEGTFISSGASEPSIKSQRAVLRGLVDQVVETAKSMKIPEDEVHDMIETSYKTPDSGQ